MTDQNCEDRVTRLEMLFSEQEYTIETLNTIVTRQSMELSQINGQLEVFRQQLKDMKKQLPESTSVDEKPPHY